jgi:hypothetical protein
LFGEEGTMRKLIIGVIAVVVALTGTVVVAGAAGAATHVAKDWNGN